MNIKTYLKTFRIIFYKYMFCFFSDEKFIKVQYFMRTKEKLPVERKTFNEKIQSYKIEYKNDLMKQCVDKIEVRQYIKNVLGDDVADKILIPLLDFNDNIEQIEFEKLPSKFILKLSNGSSFNKIVYKKEKENLKKIKRDFKFYSKAEYFYYGREWAYKNVKNRFLVEELLDFDGQIPDDYRFFCFNGKVEFITVDTNSVVGGQKNTNYNRNIYDRDWNPVDAEINYPKAKKDVSKPIKLMELVDIAEKLSKPFPHVRVDFYYFNEKIYFGELTFYHASGYQEFRPNKFALEVGDKFIL
ncbi:hypothetical protein HED34_07225 [Vagococcus fluvialis]|uniref:ATP-grasp fold amidoligase family protein n=1 Tax=Vagococcus fluvialis TaxID=2738 RepID=UPI00143287C8|nr:ATP-grasp fold amidoligase family protein [Vagococcus fluvialis]NKC59757.1 hypothetical protein [Vagococcus fluvialis]NKD50654.1 hypothetical protein [Vagococcus fluvialis]